MCCEQCWRGATLTVFRLARALHLVVFESSAEKGVDAGPSSSQGSWPHTLPNELMDRGDFATASEACVQAMAWCADATDNLDVHLQLRPGDAVMQSIRRTLERSRRAFEEVDSVLRPETWNRDISEWMLDEVVQHACDVSFHPWL